ncbi:hypothetical protein GCM10022291_17620 [Postechiella marina]|uniref:Uncharacterized protein n=1 Tax=Postechiella marina TaxID=943941 RepID=A0ABP8C909_9FLAO
MKNVITHTKKGFLMVTMFATLLSFANESSFFSIKNDAEKTSLTLESVKEGNLLSIKDENGIILYKELIQKTGTYTKGFDLTTLPKGDYLFELDGDFEISTIPFTVNEGVVKFNPDLETKTFKPFIRVEGDMVYLTKLSLNKAPLKVEIYFDNGLYIGEKELVHSEIIEDEKNIEKAYRLTGLYRGSYKISVISEGREFIKEIN